MLKILDNGLHHEDGALRYAWVHLENGGRSYYRAIALKELSVIPILLRKDYNLLGKQIGAVRGLHNAGVNFLYAACGIFKPDHIGIVQYYGAAADNDNRDAAGLEAMQGMSSVEAALSNFKQSELSAPKPRWLEWYLDFITSRAGNISVLLGHPDPREGERGLSPDGRPGSASSGDDLSTEQNEQLFRGLAALREDFVFQVLSQHVPRSESARYLSRVAEVGSIVGSRRRGSVGFGFSMGIPLMAAVGRTLSAGQSVGEGLTHSTSEGVGHGWGESHQIGRSETSSSSVTEGTSEAWGTSQGTSRTTSTGEASTQAHSSSVGGGSSFGGGSSVGGGTMVSDGWNGGLSGALGDVPIIGGIANALGVGDIRANGGINHTEGQSSSWAQSSMWSQSSSWGESDMAANTQSTGEAVSEMSSSSNSSGVFSARSTGYAVSNSEGWGTSQQWSRSQATGVAESDVRAATLGHGMAGGLSTGLLPGVNFNRSWQTEDHVADAVTEVLMQIEGLLKRTAIDGGFMTNAWIFTDSATGARAAETLAPQAFHGPDVPTPVLTVRPRAQDVESLRAHAFAALPWAGPEDGDPFGGMLWTAYATLNHCGGVAALTAPGLFEEGTASTVQTPIPEGMGFYPDMTGDIVIGHQYSPETAQLTNAQVRVDFATLMHQGFFGDTGFGKSVAAIRQVYEEVLKHHLRAVVQDFGAGWRQMLNAPGLEGHVNILQLWPDAVRPFRWNPLQIGRHINPETQWRAFSDVFGSVSQLGVKRQKQELLDSLREVYLQSGVLVDDPMVRTDYKWGKVQPGDEANLVAAAPATPLDGLTSQQRQLLAVHRSQFVGLEDLYRAIEAKLASVNARDTMLRGVLEGITMRLNQLVQGTAAKQFAPGPDCTPLENLSRPWGVTIIEGGSFLDEFSKAFLLAWVGWHLHTDMVSRRVNEVRDEPKLCIVYEEANKIFGAPKSGGEEGGGTDISSYAEAQFRDARKYGIFYKIIAQTPSAIAPGIISSCSNVVYSFLKNPKDKDLALSSIARSERGFYDEEWRRFLDDMPIGMAMGRFAYTADRRKQRTFLFRPLMLDVPEPTSEEIAERLGRIPL